MRRLLFWLVILAGVWGLYQFHDSGRNDPWDRINLQQIAITFALAVIVQIGFTRDWDIGAIGVLFTAIGTATFYGLTSIWPEVTDRRVPEGLLDIARAAYTLGGPLFLLGLIVWVWSEWRANRRPLLPDGMPERRGPWPGRRTDDMLAATALRRQRDMGDG